MKTISIIEPTFGIICILAILNRNIVIDDIICMKNHLVSDNFYNNINLQCPIFYLCLQGMTNNGRFTFSVGNQHGQFIVSIEHDK